MTNVPAWVSDAVFYAILPDRFAPPTADEHEDLDRSTFDPWDSPPTNRAYKGGTLEGITRNLDRLVELGITALYLNPIHVSVTHHRYKPIDLHHVDPMLGGDAAFARFLTAAKQRGLRVMLDAVFNHVGRGHRFFQDVIEYRERSPYRDWFRIDGFDADAPRCRVWNHNATMPTLNHDNPAVQRYLFDVAEHWAKKGIDGWRFDAPEEITAPGFWAEMRRRLRAIHPEFYLLGEIWGDATPWLDGHQWDGVTNYGFAYAVRSFVVGDNLLETELLETDVAERLDGPGYATRIDELLSRYPWEHQLAMLNAFNTHDISRLVSLAGEDPSAHRLATFLMLTFPGAPCIYYGDEVGMSGGRPMANRAGFSPRADWDHSLLDWTRALIALRKRLPALRYGRYRSVAASGGAYAAIRADETECLLIAVNTDDSCHLELPRAALDGAQAGLRLWGDGAIRITKDSAEVFLPKRTGSLFRLNETR